MQDIFEISNSIIDNNLSKELEIPVVSVFADGFKSKIGANGYLAVFHALADYLIPAGHNESDVR